MNEYVVANRENCPKCLRPARGWRERPKYGSRELYYIGCQTEGFFGSGVTPGAAQMQWERLVFRMRHDMIANAHLRVPLGQRA